MYAILSITWDWSMKDTARSGTAEEALHGSPLDETYTATDGLKTDLSLSRQSIPSKYWIGYQERLSNTGEVQLWLPLSSRFL